jgi:hypothetical protein
MTKLLITLEYIDAEGITHLPNFTYTSVAPAEIAKKEAFDLMGTKRMPNGGDYESITIITLDEVDELESLPDKADAPAKNRRVLEITSPDFNKITVTFEESKSGCKVDFHPGWNLNLESFTVSEAVAEVTRVNELAGHTVEEIQDFSGLAQI